MISLGRAIAAKPIEFQQVKTVVNSGFASAAQKTQLTQLEIVLESDLEKRNWVPGDKIYVRADSYVKPWAKVTYVVQGVEFILVPLEEIVLLEGKK